MSSFSLIDIIKLFPFIRDKSVYFVGFKKDIEKKFGCDVLLNPEPFSITIKLDDVSIVWDVNGVKAYVKVDNFVLIEPEVSYYFSEIYEYVETKIAEIGFTISNQLTDARAKSYEIMRSNKNKYVSR